MGPHPHRLRRSDFATSEVTRLLGGVESRLCETCGLPIAPRWDPTGIGFAEVTSLRAKSQDCWVGPSRGRAPQAAARAAFASLGVTRHERPAYPAVLWLGP